MTYINIKKIQISEDWMQLLHDEFNKKYMIQLKSFLLKEISNGYTIYPKSNCVFRALNITSFNKIKIVILGQDPYYNYQQANGLAFSVNDNIIIPPSLKNIYKEISNNINEFIIPKSGNLTFWGEQGILLLNSTLTVRKNYPGSHKNQGWEIFTNYIINLISVHKKNIIFFLWGRDAISKKYIIDKKRHYILTASHPSPLSAYKGFFGCNHFIKANTILRNNNQSIIDWQIKPI